MARKKLTDKEEQFCQNYVRHPDKNKRWNKTQSAIEAGYSEKTAKTIGCENLTKLHIKERVNELIEEQKESMSSLRERVKEGFESLAFPKEEVENNIRLGALNSLSKYCGMDKQSIDITTNGKELPAVINIVGVKPDGE